MADQEQKQPGTEVATFHKARLPYHDRFEAEYGISKGAWRTLVEAIWPAAKSVESVQMALAYCKARNLDPFKRPVHIVPVWSSAARATVETVWPGISEIRTTASRTKNYAGMKPAEFGPTVTKTFTDKNNKEIEVEFPEWCRVTVVRTLQGVPMDFPGPMVRWMETYAAEGGKERSEAPNAMWQKRPWGQIEKCAEAAALRRAFPEEIGNEYAAEEMEGQTIHGVTVDPEYHETYSTNQGPPASAPPPVKGKAPAVEHKPQVPMDTIEEREREPVEHVDEETGEITQAEEVPDDERRPAPEDRGEFGKHPADEERKPEPAKKAAAPKKKEPAMAADKKPAENVDGSTPEGLFNNLMKSAKTTMKQVQASGDDAALDAWMKETGADRKSLPEPFNKRMRAAIAAIYNDPLAGPDALNGI